MSMFSLPAQSRVFPLLVCTMHTRVPCTAVAVALSSLLLGGCASFSSDGGFDRVGELTQARTGQRPQRLITDADAVPARSAELLRTPLGAEGAVELAYLHQRNLQAAFGELGIAEADLVRAGRLRNPTFSFGRLAAAGVVEFERSFTVEVMNLLTMPLARDVERQRFEQAQLRAAAQAVTLANDVRRAYYAAVAAQQLVGYADQVRETADAAHALAARMAAAGNASELTRLREQAFLADAIAQQSRARQRAVAQRERLTRLIGLADSAVFTLPERLADLPAEPLALQNAEQTALQRRLDVRLATASAEATARSLGLTRVTRVVNVLEAGYRTKSETDAPRRSGYEVSLELPLFDFGTARVARAEAVYRQALDRAAATAVDARSEVRESYTAYRTAYALARHYRDEVVPLRKRIADENVLRYNGMLVGVFELLADAREQVAAVTAAIEAQRDFWIAETTLRTALTGASPGAIALDSTPERSSSAAATAGH
jgi:outer membrane protein TolC